MAQGKGGKKDPQSSTKGEHTNNIVKLSQIKRIMKNRTRMRIAKDALLATGSAFCYAISEIIDGAKNVANTDGKKKILPKHLNNAIFNDAELNYLGHDWLIKNGGMKSNIVASDLVGKKSASK